MRDGGLDIRLFGTPRVPCSSGTAAPLSERELELLAFLCLFRRRAHRRSVLAGALWGDSDERHARRSLSTTLWRLRKTIQSRGFDPDRIIVRGGSSTLRYDPEGAWGLDVDQFERAVARLGASSDPELRDFDEAEKGLRLHRADLLEGHYRTWIVAERERLRLMCLNGMAALMRYHRAEKPERAIELGQGILRTDPLREAVHRELMRLYARTGQRDLALRQYERCREILVDELGVGPMDDTRQLHVRILREELSRVPYPWRDSPGGRQDRPAGRTRDRTASPSDALPERSRLRDELNRARHHLDRADLLVDRMESRGDPAKE